MSKFDRIKNREVRETFYEDIKAVGHPVSISIPEAAFAQHIIMGYPIAKAYRETMLPANSQKTDAQVCATAHRVRYQPHFQKYLDRINERLEDLAVAKGLDVQIWLTQAIFTPIGAIDDMHPLCQKKKVTKRTKKSGDEDITVELEMVSKIEAAKMLIRMKGLDAPIKVSVDVTQKSGVMVVPQSSTVEEWEAAASTTQISLMEDAVNI